MLDLYRESVAKNTVRRLIIGNPYIENFTSLNILFYFK